jgi:pimeloyl-ACP methyl ester carboxylesterase
LNSRVNNWPTAVINAMEEFTHDFRCITMDQRNANGGESSGPVPVNDPWGAFADDQLGLMDHLGIREFFFMGYCIGGPFALKLMQRAPDRVVAGVLCQPVGHRPELPDHMYNGGRNTWAPALLARRPDLTMETIEAYLHNLFRVQPDFVYSVSRDFARSCQTPMLVMPDDTPGHPYQVSMDIAALAPKAEVTVYPWKEPKDLWVERRHRGHPARGCGARPYASPQHTPPSRTASAIAVARPHQRTDARPHDRRPGVIHVGMLRGFGVSDHGGCRGSAVALTTLRCARGTRKPGRERPAGSRPSA